MIKPVSGIEEGNSVVSYSLMRTHPVCSTLVSSVSDEESVRMQDKKSHSLNFLINTISINIMPN